MLEVPIPSLGEGHVLVRNYYSLIPQGQKEVLLRQHVKDISARPKKGLNRLNR